jgi:hypothetical protein
VTVSASALRLIACAGALAAGLLLGCLGFATADSGDSPGPDGVDGSAAPDVNAETAPDAGGGDTPGGGAPDDPDHPTVTIGNGRNDVVDPNAPVKEGGVSGVGDLRPATKYTPPSAFFTTLEIPVFTLGDVLRALSQPPPPPPSPSPAFRTQEEAPVIDATPVVAGVGGSERAAADGPKVFEVPLVVAPRMPVGGTPRLTPAGRSAALAPRVAGQPAVVGANAPLIRGSLPPSGTSETVSKPFTPMNGQATRADYPRYLRSPTAGELSFVALPGVAGLMLLTFSGGVVGYRQANSARFIRTAGATRFLR